MDLYTKEILEDALRAFDGTLLFISHDRYFINSTATCIMEMQATGVTTFHGNYDYYWEKKKSSQAAEETPVPARDDWRKKKEMESAERRRKSRIEKLEAEIAFLEAEVIRLDEKLSRDEVSRNAEAAHQVFEEKTVCEDKLAILYEEWEEASL